MGLFAGMSVVSLIKIVYLVFTAIKTKILVVRKSSKVNFIMVGNQKSKKIIKFNRDHVLCHCSQYFLKFAELTSIDGIHDMVNRKKSTAERLFWIFVTLVSVTLCTILIIDVTKNAELSPIEFGIDEKIWTLKDVTK